MTPGIIIIGAGFAGAATAAALARAGAGPGIILEGEPLPGMHASGRNAAIARGFEFDEVVRALALASLPALGPLVQQTGGIYLSEAADHDRFARCAQALAPISMVTVLDRPAALARFPDLAGFHFTLAAHAPTDGTLDIHGLLHDYLDEARRGRFALRTHTPVREVLLQGARVTGVLTAEGPLPAAVVVDATGAWAGRLGRRRPLPLTALRRHLLLCAGAAPVPPLLWDVHHGYYLRREGAGLLASPCDETPHEPSVPAADPAAAELLAHKLGRHAPPLVDLEVRSAWACLRTFAPDRRPVIGWDPEVQGLFHVSALGGFGASSSRAVGEVAAALLHGDPAPYIAPATVDPGRPGLQPT